MKKKSFHFSRAALIPKSLEVSHIHHRVFVMIFFSFNKFIKLVLFEFPHKGAKYSHFSQIFVQNQ